VSDAAKITFAAWLGRQDYGRALGLQKAACNMKKNGLDEDFLFLLEHPPTITLGRNGDWRNLIASDETLKSLGVQRFETDRGGDITFHGPGQLVCYPILQLRSGERDVHVLMRALEQSLIELLAEYGIESERKEKLTGVWTNSGKIAAMGIHISRWITRHGFALNVNTDVSYFDLIVPCGIAGKGVVSMGALTGKVYFLEEVARHFAVHFERCFKRSVRWLAAEDLILMLEQGSGRQG
jgi:lipoate-protein ligase B